MGDLFDLTGKVAIITGGNGGIGKGIARGLAGAGADIVIAGRKQAKTADTVAGLIKEFGRRVIGIDVDLKEPDQVQSFAGKALEQMGRADILVNNAGVNIRKMPQDYALAEWDEVIDTNLAPYSASKGGVLQLTRSLAIRTTSRSMPFSPAISARI